MNKVHTTSILWLIAIGALTFINPMTAIVVLMGGVLVYLVWSIVDSDDDGPQAPSGKI